MRWRGWKEEAKQVLELREPRWPGVLQKAPGEAVAAREGSENRPLCQLLS